MRVLVSDAFAVHIVQSLFKVFNMVEIPFPKKDLLQLDLGPPRACTWPFANTTHKQHGDASLQRCSTAVGCTRSVDADKRVHAAKKLRHMEYYRPKPSSVCFCFCFAHNASGLSKNARTRASREDCDMIRTFYITHLNSCRTTVSKIAQFTSFFLILLCSLHPSFLRDRTRVDLYSLCFLFICRNMLRMFVYIHIA